MTLKQEYNNFDAYDDKILDPEDITGIDVKINPDFYIHIGLVKAQQCLTSPNMIEGFLQYRVIVEHIEVLAKASNLLENDYDDKLADFKKSEDYVKVNEDYAKNVKLAQYKLRLLMSNIFNSKAITKGLRA